MGIWNTIKDFFRKKTADQFAEKITKDVLPKLMGKAEENFLPKLRKQMEEDGYLTEAAEEMLKEQLKGVASELVREQMDKHVQIPDVLQDLKDKLVEMAVDSLVDLAYQAIQESLAEQAGKKVEEEGENEAS